MDAATSKLQRSLGGTNFYAGLKVAFDMLTSSLTPTGNTITSSCQICEHSCLVDPRRGGVSGVEGRLASHFKLQF